MASSAPEDEFLTVISGNVIKAVLNKSQNVLQPHQSYTLRTGIKVQVNQPAIILATQFTPESQPCKRYDTNLQIKHAAFEAREIDNVTVSVHNPTDRPLSPATEPLALYIYAVPLEPVAIPQLVLQRGDNRKHRLPVADTVIQQIDSAWHSRLTVSRLIWTRNQSRYRPHGVFHTTSFVFNPQNMPLDSVNMASELVCSLSDTHVTNLQRINKQEIKVYLECLRDEPPDSKAFIHLSWTQGRYDVVPNRNPKPFLIPHDRNGFIILCPQTLHLKAGKTSHIMFDICFESDKYVGIICPRNIPGASFTCNPLMNSQALFMEARAEHESLYVEKFEPIGWLHFIKRRSLLAKNPTAAESPGFIDQSRIMAKLEYDDIYSGHVDDESSDSSSSDSDMEHSRPTSSRRKSRPPPRSRTPSVRGKRKADASDDVSDDEDGRDNLMLCWPNWQCGMRVQNLTPMIATVSSEIFPATEFFWGQNDEYRTFHSIEGEWRPYQTQRRRRYPRSEAAAPTQAPYTASVSKKHRS
ncbi:protein UL83B [Mandrillus leucophaeus cytomegalovirus]|uniref:Protein UL83B n=1 Tax=Mandrillus leucophaeus cytomegalovirus TaxID=1654930 RepID=A0A0G2UI37_9BETA|nr:protein UL83B [Mandrillus leucophaeus cytomegalovirus]AKI29764.1 protein UL83B [Mandrillus leucophaeus cytomegalovirus]